MSNKAIQNVTSGTQTGKELPASTRSATSSIDGKQYVGQSSSNAQRQRQPLSSFLSRLRHKRDKHRQRKRSGSVSSSSSDSSNSSSGSSCHSNHSFRNRVRARLGWQLKGSDPADQIHKKGPSGLQPNRKIGRLL